MRKGIRIGLRLLGLSTVVVLVAAVVLTCYALNIKSQAEALLNDLTALKPGISTGAEARQFAERHKKLLFQVSNDCSDDTCSRVFGVQNKWLSASRLEPPAEFTADVTVKHGTVDSIGAILFRSMPIYPTFGGSAGKVDEYIELPRHMRSPDLYYFPTPVGKPYLRVVLDSHAAPLQRQHAFEFSFMCLVKPGGGCDLPCDYLPSAWQDWRVSLRESSYPQDDFNHHYPKNVRCKP